MGEDSAVSRWAQRNRRVLIRGGSQVGVRDDVRTEAEAAELWLLVLTTDGATSRGMEAAPDAGKGQETLSPQASRKHSPADTLT